MNSTDFEPAERDELDNFLTDEADAARREYGVPDLRDVSPAAAARIRRFVSESTIRGGSPPSDVADLYLAQEVVADPLATEYLDRRFVHGEMPTDWRSLQDTLTEAHFASPPYITAEALLARADQAAASDRRPRSIFDDPDDLDEYADGDDDRATRLEERDPTLGDLTDDGRRSIERMVIADVLCYGIAPYRMMELRERLRAAGDDRSLQYLDLPFELGDRPPDWDRLRDEALMMRASLERRGIDPADQFSRADGMHPELAARELLTVLEDLANRR